MYSAIAPRIPLGFSLGIPLELPPAILPGIPSGIHLEILTGIPAEILLGLRSEFPLLFFFSLLVHQDFWVWFVISSGIHSGITPGIPSLILAWIPFRISPDIQLGIPPEFFH